MEYFEKESGIVAKVDSVIISARDAPLKDIFMETASLSKVNCYILSWTNVVLFMCSYFLALELFIIMLLLIRNSKKHL